MFGPLGGPELLVIFLVALVVFGPRKLPEVGKSLGRMLSEFRRASNDLKRTIESEVEAEQLREVASLSKVDLEPVEAAAAPSDPAAATPNSAALAAPAQEQSAQEQSAAERDS